MEISANKVLPTDNTIKHNPPELANELWAKVFQNLDFTDVKSVRLTWKSWSDLGARFIFQPFVFRPDRDDTARFESVMNNPTLSAGTNHLIFETGSFKNLYFITNSLARAYRIKYNFALRPDCHGRKTV